MSGTATQLIDQPCACATDCQGDEDSEEALHGHNVHRDSMLPASAGLFLNAGGNVPDHKDLQISDADETTLPSDASDASSSSSYTSTDNQLPILCGCSIL